MDDEAFDAMNSVMNLFDDSIYFDDEIKDNLRKIKRELYARIEKIIDDEDFEKNPNLLNITSYDEDD